MAAHALLRKVAKSDPPAPHNVEAQVVESCAPDFTLWKLLLPQPKHLAAAALSRLLGRWKPVAAADEVWLLDNTAFLDADTNVWRAEFVAAVFAREVQHTWAHGPLGTDAVLRRMAAKIGGIDDDALATIERRLRPFLLAPRPGRRVLARNDKTPDMLLRLGPGGRDGISRDTRAVCRATTRAEPGDDGTTVVITTALGTTAGMLQCRTFLAGPEGWGVVSDVDDTIKVTLTAERTGVLHSTFVVDDPPRAAVAGMPELYAFIEQRATTTSSRPFFVYLSASPYQLYPFLRGFLGAAGYPPGQLMLRDSPLAAAPDTQRYKTERLRRIRGWFPRRRIICVGDSTQTDPEAYAAAYRAWPGWIGLILIRRVTGVVGVGLWDTEEERNGPGRFERAFRGVPRSVWFVFDDPSECYPVVRDVVGSCDLAGGNKDS